MKKNAINLLLAAFLMLAATGPARAELLGDTLQPFVSVAEMYDSNLFRVRDRAALQALIGDDRLDDFITIASLGTGVRHQLSRQELDLLLRRDFIRYHHYSDQDVDRDEVKGGLSLLFLDALRVRLDGAYLRSPEPRSDYRSPDLNERKDLAAGVLVGYEMPSGLGLEWAYRWMEVKYSLPQFRTSEHDVNRYTATVSWKISPESRIYAAYQRDDTAYDQLLPLGAAVVDNSNIADSLRVGLEKVFSPRSSLSCSGGYLKRRNKASAARDFSGVVGKAVLGYGLTQKLGLKLRGERKLAEETFASSIYSISDSVGADLVYQLTEKVKGTLGGQLSRKDFQNLPQSGVDTRSDRTQELNAGLEWTPMEGLSVTASYGLAKRRSDEQTFDFTDHIAMASLGYHF